MADGSNERARESRKQIKRFAENEYSHFLLDILTIRLMINPNNASLTFTRFPGEFRSDVLMAQVSISVQYVMPSGMPDQAGKNVVEATSHSIIYGDLMSLIEKAKDFSLETTASEYRKWVADPFKSVALFEPREIPVEINFNLNSVGQQTVTGVSGITTWLPLDNVFANKTHYIERVENELKWRVKAYLYEGLFQPLINAQHSAMNFSCTGWQAVKTVFEPMFDGMIIDLPTATRVNYPESPIER